MHGQRQTTGFGHIIRYMYNLIKGQLAGVERQATRLLGDDFQTLDTAGPDCR